MSAAFPSRLLLRSSLRSTKTPKYLSCTLCLRGLSTPSVPAPKKEVADFAFAFDIDGVLLHGERAHPTAKATFAMLKRNNIKFLLLTNGGGKTEARRATLLTTSLGVSFSKSQIVQSHTPFRDIAAKGIYKTILVVGGIGDNCREIAECYGFKKILIPRDIYETYPAISPFTERKNCPKYAKPIPKDSPVKFDAILVFNDPRDWAMDLQIILDILLSDNGVLGTRGAPGAPHIPIYFSNPDLLWANEYPLPRLGQGGFRAALEGAWTEVTGGKQKMQKSIIGKPHALTYDYAEKKLLDWIARASSPLSPPPLKRVYMVGDNPASDIAGANTFKSSVGTEWISVLVRSGVYKDGDSTGGAKVVVDDVLQGVEWAMEREGMDTKK